MSDRLDKDRDLDAKEHDIGEQGSEAHDSEEHGSKVNHSEEHDKETNDSEELAHEQQEDHDHDKDTKSFSEALKDAGEIKVESNNTFFVGVLLPRQQYSGSHPFEVMYHQFLHHLSQMI